MMDDETTEEEELQELTYTDEEAESPEEERSLPGWVMPLAYVGSALVLLAGVAALVIVLNLNRGGFTVLNAADPATLHPDGLTLSLNGSDEARVRVETVARELFLSDSAGRVWQDARAALPQDLEPLSPIYQIEVRSGQVLGEMSIPNGAEPRALLDLMMWDEQAATWVFVPSTINPNNGTIAFSANGTMDVVAVRNQPTEVMTGAVLTADAPDLSTAVAMPLGAEVDASGQLVGMPEAATTAGAVKPLVRSMAAVDYGADLTSDLLALAADYDGLTLDLVPNEGYAAFVAGLAEQLAAQGKTLDVVVRGDQLNRYNLAALSQNADFIWLAPGADPTLYLQGITPMLDVFVANVNRDKAGLLVSASTAAVSEGQAAALTFDEASTLLGEVIPIDGYYDPAAPLAAGGSFAARLSGSVEAMGFDEALGMNYLAYSEGGTPTIVYFASGQALGSQLEWAQTYGLAGAAVEGTTGAPQDVVDAFAAFPADAAVEAPASLEIVWRVADSGGNTVTEQAGDLTLIQYLWQATETPGSYAVEASLRTASQTSSLGQVALQVGDPQPEEPIEEDAEAAEAPAPEFEFDDEEGEDTPPPATDDTVETDTPTVTPEPPVTTGTIAGGFELGGQTHSLANPDAMRAAGMTWVKFQHKWGPGDDPNAVAARIADAHAKGFKVLLAIPGALYPESIEYAAYIEFLRGVAALGPDAIEVWNEMNLDREWPVGQIDGANYVNNMLAPAYNAIKSTNPNVIVIGGAPAPTGFFGGCQPNGCDDWFYLEQMAAAGAANYMDCMGVHYNEGIIPPGQTTGDPRDEFYSRYFWGMTNLYYGAFGVPLCYTELGYLSGDGYPELPAAFNWAAGTSVDQQAQWLAEAAVLASNSGMVRMMIIFNVDIFVYGSDPQGGYAIIRPDGSCPACEALAAVSQ